MSPDTILRAAGPDDAQNLAAFWAAQFAASFAHMYKPEDLVQFVAETYDEARIAAQLADPGYVHAVAVAGDEIQGAIKLGRVSLADQADDQTWELHRLYVAAPHKGSGLAQSLMDWGKAALQRAGKTRLVLAVYCDNRRAQAFYARHGFRKIGEGDFPVGTHTDRVFIFECVEM